MNSYLKGLLYLVVSISVLFTVAFGVRYAKNYFSRAGKPEPNLSTFDPDKFREKYGSYDSAYDLNHDGVVNLNDYSLYLQGQ